MRLAAIRADAHDGQGFALLPPGWAGPLAPEQWAAFAASWDDLPLDTHMGDGGRYRRRRYGAFRVAGGAVARLPHQAHYQTLDYNPLNGGVERWFAPIEAAVAESAPFSAAVRGMAALAGVRAPQLLEAHQFRIEAHDGAQGLPTPEGLHSDGRDWVLILFVGARNIAGGETRVTDGDGRPLLHATLSQPGEAMLLDDRAVRHAVSPVTPAVAGMSAYRDVLVLTMAGV